MTINNVEKDLLAVALTDEPPLRIDLSTLVTKGCRRRQARRTGAVAVVIVGVASIAAVSVLAVAARPDHEPPAAGATAATTLTTTRPPGSAAGCGSEQPPGTRIDNTTPSAEDSARSLAVNQMLIGAWRTADLGLPPGYSLSYGAEGHPWCVDNGGWSLVADLATPQGKRLLRVDIWPTATRTVFDCAHGGQQVLECTGSAEGDLRVRILTELVGGPGHAIVQRSAETIDPGGVTVSVMDTSKDAPGFTTGSALPISVLTYISMLPSLAAHW